MRPSARARERHAVVLQLDHRSGRFLAHELDRVLVAEPVRTFHGVVHVPAPVVVAHVAERGADAALRGDRMTSRGEQLRDARGRQARFGQAERGSQPCAAGADDEHVVGVIDDLVSTHSKATFSTAKIAAAATKKCAKADRISEKVFVPVDGT